MLIWLQAWTFKFLIFYIIFYIVSINIYMIMLIIFPILSNVQWLIIIITELFYFLQNKNI